MKNWLKDWLDTHGGFLGFLLFGLIAALLLKGCSMIG